MKTCAWFPMCFGPVVKKNDKRMSIEDMGSRKEVKKSSQLIRVIAHM